MKEINLLLNYSLEKKIINKRDVIYYTNLLCNTLGCEYFEFEDIKYDGHIDELLDLIEKKFLKAEISELVECNKSYIMNLLMPPPSSFQNMSLKEFFEYMKNVNYIKTKNLSKNVEFQGSNKYGKLLISINLTKPEKDPLEIEKLKNLVVEDSNYPQCPLCVENEGYYGAIGKADRSNHRMIEYKENYFFQFSPYQYYNEHAIILSKKHTPMVINKNTFNDLCDFVDLYPNYFIGSNADLPIVGGSILNHAHYQAGNFNFPLFDASTLFYEEIDNVKTEVLNWPMNVIKLSSKNREEMIDRATNIMDTWSSYSNEKLGIFAKTSEQHSTITPICRKYGDTYQIYIVLRNNIKSEEHPFGVFHPHIDKHFLKKENIGLIEAMGLAILPPRILESMIKYQSGIPIDNYPNDVKIEEFIIEIFTKVLEDCAVFKNLEDIKEIIKN